MKSKKGLELTINFLVIIIISLVMLGLAGIFFKKFFTGASQVQADYDKQTEEELKSLLVQGKKVAIPFTRKEVQGGQHAVFGLGVLNVLGHYEEFEVLVECTKFIDYEGFDSNCNLEYEDPQVDSPLKLDNNQHAMTSILILTDKEDESGTYIFNVCVCEGDCNPPFDCDSDINNLYDDHIHKLYLKVK